MANRFDLVDLQLFQHIVQAASITHGARRANMSLAAASERLRDLEESLGAPLFIRKRRGVELTEAGSAFARHAYALNRQLEQMRSELAGFSNGLRGHIRLLANTTSLFEYLPDILSRFLSANPNIDIDLEDRLKRDIIAEVAAGRADIGIFGGAFDAQNPLEIVPFTENRLVVVAPLEHPFGLGRKSTFATALEHDFIGHGEHSSLQAFLEHQARLAGRRMKVRVRLNGFEAVCRFVADGIGLAVVPEATGRRWERALPIRVAPLSDPWTVRNLKICVRNHELLSPHAQTLLAHLRTQPFAQSPADGAARARS